MKSILFACIVILGGSLAQALTPKLTCQSPQERNGRYFRIDIIYSPLYQTTSTDVSYVSEYGVEPVSKVFLKKPGYTTTDIYFSEAPFNALPVPGSPGIPFPASTNHTPFKMVVNKSSLSGLVEFSTVGFQNTKTYKLKVKCDKTQWPNL